MRKVRMGLGPAPLGSPEMGKQRPTIVHMISSPVRSAPREVMYRIVDAIDRDSFQPAVAFLRRGLDEAEDFGFGDMLADFEALDVPVYVGSMERKYQLHDATLLDRFLRDVGAKLLVSHLPRADLWATAMAWWGRCHNVRLLHGAWEWWYAHTDPDDIPRPSGTAIETLDRILLRYTDRIACVSPATLASLRDEQNIPEAKLVWMRTGIDVERYRVADAAFADDRPVTFGMVTRVIESKGVFEFLDAIAAVQKRHPHTRALIAGDGPDLDRAKAHADESGAVVEFYGHVADVAAVLGRFDVFALPSWSEGTPLSLLEALAAGRLPVVSDVGGMPYIVEHDRNGVVVEVKDREGLAAAFEAIVTDRARARAMAAAALGDSALYSLEQMARGWDALYHDLLD